MGDPRRISDASTEAFTLHSCRAMACPYVDDTQPESQRPTIPSPPPAIESGIRLSTMEFSAARGATVDVVLCDLRCDPRSEDFTEFADPSAQRSGFYASHGAEGDDSDHQNERPPSTSIVRALK
jgi:hypothetical protein